MWKLNRINRLLKQNFTNIPSLKSSLISHLSVISYQHWTSFYDILILNRSISKIWRRELVLTKQYLPKAKLQTRKYGFLNVEEITTSENVFINWVR